MESSRGILLLALAFITFLLYQEWQADYGVQPKVEQQTVTSEPAASTNGIPDVSKPVQPNSSVSGIPEVTSTDATSETVASTQLVSLKSDVLSIKVNTHGGDVVAATLLQFNQKLNDPSEKVDLLTQNNGRVFIAKSALLGDGAPDTAAKRATYEVVESTSSNGEHKLVLRWVNDDGVEFLKTFQLADGHYDIDVSYQVNNTSDRQLDYQLMTQMNRDQLVVDAGDTGFGLQAYTGAAYSDDEYKYEKHDFDEMKEEPLKSKTTGGWVAFLQHYFLAAWIPNQDSINQLHLFYDNDSDFAVARIFQQWESVSPGTSKDISAKLYLGPKDQEELAKIAEGLDLTVDYSIFWWIGQPIFWLLTFFHKYVIGNWGVAIILVTVTVKAALYPLASAQYRSFAKMRMLSPKLQQLKERYGDDRQKMSMAMMDLYKKEKVNPMGGCLPLLIQMPVFLALYWVLLESYEIRHAPFMLWIQDLSAKDPYFILPILMGISMWGMQKLQPTAATMDPMQQKIMQFLPIMMTVFFMFFPAGLVLYWLVNNLLSIAQQLYITNKIEKQYAAKKKT